MSRQKENYWSTYGFRIIISTASHPLEYAKVLIQIGYEPFPPKPATSLLGKPVLKLPNIFEYVKHIKTVDGFSGCYRGLVPKILGNTVGALASQKVLDSFDFDKPIDSQDDNRTEAEKERDRYVKTLTKEVVSRFTAIVFSQPFHVITIRMMAQFVGGETKYNGVFGSVREIYRENGLSGFFSGLIPRVLGDIISLCLASSLIYCVNTYLLEDKELQMYTSVSMSFLASTLTYPFLLISNCMAVTGSGLAAGAPPYMPVYTSWVDCWSHLSRTGQMKRGSSLLVRYYNGPQVVINGRAVPINIDGKNY
ncbi:mitochondrial carrier homolog 2-like [Chrysoperla carnea]|uniref:mitochondrial carrier homolog 2-like n=1 Tax=Chrysoperla carnea TaxID=189513 RepID=UPI001D08E0E2|nr:mitochondrial carrier homolog 2-like [Chrysoperla carnea]